MDDLDPFSLLSLLVHSCVTVFFSSEIWNGAGISLLESLGTLKAKIAKLKSELINGPGGKSAGTKNAERGFEVTKSGDTRIGLVGFPSVGKSTLLTSLTGTRSEAAAYEFTTLTCIPGTMKCK